LAGKKKKQCAKWCEFIPEMKWERIYPFCDGCKKEADNNNRMHMHNHMNAPEAGAAASNLGRKMKKKCHKQKLGSWLLDAVLNPFRGSWWGPRCTLTPPDP
jgi:hypothetical protein